MLPVKSLLILAITFLNLFNFGYAQDVNLEEDRSTDKAPNLEYKEGRIKVDYLGKQQKLNRHLKPLPHKQYEFSHTYPNTDAKVIIASPETPLLKIDTKQPFEKDRLIAWLQEWDRVKKNRELAHNYESSYQKLKDRDYLEQSFKLQQSSIMDLFALQKNSWPNSEYAYKAHKAKVSACNDLLVLVNTGNELGMDLEKPDTKICNYFP